MGQTTQAWQEKFQKALVKRYPNAKSLDKSATQGMIAKPYVVNIERNWNAVWGGSDYMNIEVELYNAATQEKIGLIKVKSDSIGVGPAGWSFGGRIGFCAVNAGDLLGRCFVKNCQ